MKRKIFLFFIFSFLAPVGKAQEKIGINSEKIFDYYQAAKIKSVENEHHLALLYIDSALAIAPHYAQIRYTKAQFLQASGNPGKALLELEILLGQKQQYVKNVIKDTLFKNHPKFQEFITSLNQLEDPVNNALEYIQLQEKDLVPEGVAFDSLNKSLFISSIYKRKIIKIDVHKNVTDFTTSGQDDLLSVIGMEADAARRHLWVCSSYQVANDIINSKGLQPQAAIHKLDLDTGKLLEKYILNDTLSHFFNDLTVLPNGDVYFTDTNQGMAYRILKNEKKIEPLFLQPILISANGITRDSGGKNLFIASWLRGIIKYNVRTGLWKWIVSEDPRVSTSGVDGLAYYKGNLILNSPIEIGGVIKLKLNEAEDEVESMEVLEYRNIHFGETTTGEIDEDNFFFIANAGLSAYDKNGNLDQTKLNPPVILQIKLK